MSNKKGYESLREGFIKTSYWDEELKYTTVDEEGVQVDCYSRIVDEINEKHNEVNKYYKREKVKNVLINSVYKFQLRFMIFALISTFVTLGLYIWTIVYNNRGYVSSFLTMLEGRLKPSMYSKLDMIVGPFLNNIDSYGLENVYKFLIMVFVLASVVGILCYMLSRNHAAVSWFTKMLHIKPMCEIKENSDRRLGRLQSDLYSIQLRRHEVKFASHSE